MSVFRRSYNDSEMAALLLREQLSAVAPDVADSSPAMGCCGCGSWLCDVVTYLSPGYLSGEGYCWKCVKRKDIQRDDYRVLEGRER